MGNNYIYDIIMPKISVIVAVYNVEKYIGRCIESIQKQTLTDWELILVDDCSPDNSDAVIQEYVKHDKRITVLHQNENHGPMVARRRGDETASGDYITYCDGDDMLPEEALELLYFAAQKSNADIVSGNMVYVKTNGSKEMIKNYLKYGNNKKAVFKSLLRGDFHHNLCGKLFKASILKDFSYRPYDHFTNGEDGYVFYLAVNHIENCVQIDEPVYYYMQNMQSSTNVRLNENAIKSICVLNKTKNDIVSLYPELKADLQKHITNVLCSLYSCGYDKDARLNYYINEYGLSGYVTIPSIIKNCKLANLIRLMIRRALLLIK